MYNICLVIDGERQEETSHNYPEILDDAVLDHYLSQEFARRRLQPHMDGRVWLEIKQGDELIKKIF